MIEDPPPPIKRGPRNLVRWLNDLRKWAIRSRVAGGGVTGWKQTPHGQIPPPPTLPGGAAADKSCCGISEHYYSNELNTAFRRAPGERQLVETQETAWAGMTITEGSDGVWVAVSGSYQWTGSEPGIDGVTFNATAGDPTPSSFTLFPLPEKLVATVAGDAYTLDLVTTGGPPLQYTGTYVLRWLWSQGPDGTWILGDLWERAAKVGDMAGGYEEPGSDPANTAHVGLPETAGGENGQVQRNSGGALMGSSAFRVVNL